MVNKVIGPQTEEPPQQIDGDSSVPRDAHGKGRNGAPLSASIPNPTCSTADFTTPDDRLSHVDLPLLWHVGQPHVGISS